MFHGVFVSMGRAFDIVSYFVKKKNMISQSFVNSDATLSYAARTTSQYETILITLPGVVSTVST